MTNYLAYYPALADQLHERGIDVEAVKAQLKKQQIETPSWGYGDSGTRFKVFPWPGAARNVHEKLADAAYIHKLTGVAPSVLLVTGNFDCYQPPKCYPSAWTDNNDLTPSVLQVSQNCCSEGAITDRQQGALVQLAKNGGGPGPSFNPPQFNPPKPPFNLPKPDFNFPQGGYCNEAWTGLPMEAPALLI